jgi:hypothetical protein
MTRRDYADRASAVRALSLAGNDLTDQHAAMLLRGLDGLMHLERIDFSSNHLTQITVSAFAAAVSDGRARSVRFLYP